MGKAVEITSDTGIETKVYFQVIDHIRTLVQDGEISIGERLPSERQLMATLGLSRNSIREAYRSLENLGILESRHGQGNFLVNNTSQSLGSMFSLLLVMKACSFEEISQLRRTIEIGAFLLAAKQASDAGISELSYALHEMEQAGIEARTRLDKKFHDILIKISGNRLLELFNETLSQLFESNIGETLTHISDAEWEELLGRHAAIYDSLSARDVQAGIDAVMEHYDPVKDRKI